MSDIHVIESDDYREEEATLKADPIVIKMAEEAKDSTPEEREGHVFTMLALETYKVRGGTQARSIGSVARAIRALLAEKETPS